MLLKESFYRIYKYIIMGNCINYYQDIISKDILNHIFSKAYFLCTTCSRSAQKQLFEV